MKRPRASLLRRIVMGTAGVVLTLSVAAWGFSLFQIGWGGSLGVAGLSRGTLVMRSASSPAPHPNGWLVLGLNWEQEWWPWDMWNRSRIVVPLWLPTALSAVPFVLTFAVERRDRERARIGQCSACHYDLTGLTGPCPECGSEQKNRA